MRNKLLLLLTTQGTVYFGIALFAPLYAIYVEQIGGEFITAGLAIAVFSAVTGTATIFMGRIASFLPHPKYLAVAGWFLLGVGFLGYLLVQKPIHLFLVQVLIGLATATYFPPVEAMYSRWITRERDVFEWSWWDATEYWSGAAGALAGGIIVTFFGFPALFVTMATLAFLAAFVLFILLNE